MGRNLKNEAAWAKSKLIRFETKLDKEQYGKYVDEIKETIGSANFLRKAIEIYVKYPELFSSEDWPLITIML